MGGRYLSVFWHGVVFFVIAAVCFLFCSAGVRGAGAIEEKDCAAEMTCVVGEDGEVEVALKVVCEGGVCGLLGELEYDAESFLLLSCGSDAEGVDFSYYDGGGAVRILLDGVENTVAAIVLVRFYFKRVEGAIGSAVFSLGDIEAFYLSAKCELCELDVEVGVGSVEVGVVNAPMGADKKDLPVLTGAEVIRSEGGEVEIILSEIVGREYFAAGFKIFFVDLDSGEVDEMYIFGVLDRSGGGEVIFERRVEHGERGRFSVVVTPLAIDREGVVEGEKYACVASVILRGAQ